MKTKMSKQKPLITGRSEKEVLAGAIEALSYFAGQLEFNRQNIGGMYNENNRFVKFGNPGDPDLSGQIIKGKWKGCVLGIECKKEFFDPSGLTGKDKIHFERQVERLKSINKNGGVGFWIDQPERIIQVMPRILEGWRVGFEGYYPYITDEKD